MLTQQLISQPPSWPSDRLAATPDDVGLSAEWPEYERRRDTAVPRRARAPAGRTGMTELRHWVRSQMINADRHSSSVRRFRRADYGEGPMAPKEANIHAVNTLLSGVSRQQQQAVERLRRIGEAALAQPTRDRLSAFARAKDAAHMRTRLTEKVWMFYENLFEQRTGAFAPKLYAMDRIALDCYQSCYMGLGKARSIPTPPPMAYVEAGYGPATYRRGVKLTRLGKRANPFPLVKLPYHRLINPWSLGAVPHEIGHNLQNDLSLWPVVPRQIEQRLRAAGIPAPAVAIWKRWHKEIYADLIGILLIGPYYISSLMDVVGKSSERVARFRAKGVHPTSYVRPLINTALLRSIGFQSQAAAFEQGWRRLYPASIARRLPEVLWRSFPKAAQLVVNVICFTPHPAYGGKRLTDVVRFRPQDMTIVREAAQRLAAGTNPGIVPERFLICAARDALERRLAPPERITRNFYTALTGR